MGGTRKYTIVMEAGEDGQIVVRCPTLPGCWSQGKTRDEALANIREAIELYLESLSANGEVIPEEDATTIEVAV